MTKVRASSLGGLLLLLGAVVMELVGRDGAVLLGPGLVLLAGAGAGAAVRARRPPAK